MHALTGSLLSKVWHWPSALAGYPARVLVTPNSDASGVLLLSPQTDLAEHVTGKMLAAPYRTRGGYWLPGVGCMLAALRRGAPRL